MGFSETVSKNRRGRPRKHQDFHAMATAYPNNPLYSRSRRNNANAHYSAVAVRHLATLDEDLAWVWKSQVVRTELGRVIEVAGVNAATDVVKQIATAHPNRKIIAHEVARGIRAGRLKRDIRRGGTAEIRQFVADMNTWSRMQVLLERAGELKELLKRRRRVSKQDREWLAWFETCEAPWVDQMFAA